MSLSTIASAIGAAARDFAGHTGSTPPTSYFAALQSREQLLEHPFNDLPFDHPEMEKVRLRLALDRIARDDRRARGLRTGSPAELRRLGVAL